MTTDIIYSQFDFDKLSRPEQIDILEVYYANNSLYEATRMLKYYLGVWSEDIRPLRTPVQRSVGFYVAKIAIGEPKISSTNASVRDAVSQIMENSNFQVVKPLQVQRMALHGDLFRKAVVENGKPFHEVIETRNVTSYVEDNRGFLQEIRIDTPIEVDGVDKTRTEFWTVLDNIPYMAIWEHQMNSNTPTDQLGDPIFYRPLSKLGIDWVPFVRSPFKNSGRPWGDSCVQHALLKVDEANRQATRLHQTLFRYNKPTWVVSANGSNADGTAKKAPKIKSATDADKRDVTVRDNTILYLDGEAKIDSLIPDIDYKGALDILLSQEKELEKDLPELLYYSLPDSANLSGEAIRNLLGAAVDRAQQGQSNFVEGTVRLNQMCITLGQVQGVYPASLGTFDAGSFKHSIRFGEQFPVGAGEKATTLASLVNALGQENLKLAMQLSGYSEEEVAEVKIPQPKPVDTVSSGSDNQQE